MIKCVPYRIQIHHYDVVTQLFLPWEPFFTTLFTSTLSFALYLILFKAVVTISPTILFVLTACLIH